MFADGSFDRTGPPRAVNQTTTCIKRKKNNPSPQETIIIPNSDDNGRQHKGKQKAPDPPTIFDTLSLSGSDGIQKAVNPPVEKRTLLLRKCRPAQEQTAGLKEMLSEVEVLDISSPSGSEFKPEEGGKQQSGGAEDEDEDETTSEGAPESDGDNPCKRKAKRELASRPLKKRTFVEVRPVSYRYKAKGKAPACSLKRGHIAASPASSDDKVSLSLLFAMGMWSNSHRERMESLGELLRYCLYLNRETDSRRKVSPRALPLTRLPRRMLRPSLHLRFASNQNPAS